MLTPERPFQLLRLLLLPGNLSLLNGHGIVTTATVAIIIAMIVPIILTFIL